MLLYLSTCHNKHLLPGLVPGCTKSEPGRLRQRRGGNKWNELSPCEYIPSENVIQIIIWFQMLYSRIKIYLCTKRFIYISTITIIIINTNNNINRIRFGLSITSKQCIFSFLNGSWMANIDFKVMLSWFHTKWQNGQFGLFLRLCMFWPHTKWPKHLKNFSDKNIGSHT